MTATKARPFDPARLDRLQRELRMALQEVPARELTAWGRRSAALFGAAGVRRTRELWQFGGSVLRWSHNEVATLGRETRAGRGLAHLSERLRALRDGTGAAAKTARVWLDNTVRALRRDPRAAAPRLLASVITQLAGGERQDGKAGTAEIAMNSIDVARNVAKPAGFAGDILTGAALEAGFFALVDLARMLADRLPSDHDPLWDRLIAGRGWMEQALQGSGNEANATPPLPPPPPLDT
jgi:hypothetical protein